MKTKKKILTITVPAVLAAVGLILAASPAHPIGLLVPTDRQYDPLELKSQVMKVKIDNQTAQTQIHQVFHNRYGRAIEATYLMPIPKGAHVTDFVMEMNGKKVRGEVLEKEKARQIYTNIVRRMRDPGLVEYVDQELFRARVFPIPPNGDQKVEITVTHLLSQDNNVVEYQWPFEPPKAVKQRGRPTSADEFDVKLDIRSRVPIKSVYSPTHKVNVDQENNKHAVVRLDEQPTRDEPIFRCYYTLSKKAVGLHVLTAREEDENGTFLLMISPGKFYEGKESPPVDFTFVIDSSGSMNDDNKMEAAKKALNYCLGSLREQDAFKIVRFSTEVEPFSEKFLKANGDNLKKARKFVSDMRARGGTNIDAALAQALGQKAREDRLHTILFITDGKPTVGVTNVDTILKNVEKRNDERLRVFACGVGYDVNTKLLDRLSEQTRSVVEYIRPKEDLEVAIGKLFDKISQPVLTNLEIDWGGLEVRHVYPKELPDLFSGTQLTVFGRYKNGGDFAITLTGKVGPEKKKYVYEATFREKEHTAHKFIEPLWSTRRVGYLLDQIREHGESKELRDEVVELAKKHGIVTPYTSYLVQEDKRVDVAMTRAPARQLRRTSEPAPSFGRRANGGFGGSRSTSARAGAGQVLGAELRIVDGSAPVDQAGSYSGRGARALDAEGSSQDARRMLFETMRDRSAVSDDPGSVKSGIAMKPTARPTPVAAPEPAATRYLAMAPIGRESSGRNAVEYSEGLKMLKGASTSELLSGKAEGYKNVEGRSFQQVSGVWKEMPTEKAKKQGEEKKRKTLKIKYLSDAYFELLKIRPDLKKVLALGERVELDVNDFHIVVGPEGLEKKLNKEQVDALKKK